MVKKIDLTQAIQRSCGCTHVEPIADLRDRLTDGLFAHLEEPESNENQWRLEGTNTWVCSRCVSKQTRVGEAVKKFERQSNGSRPLVMTSHIVNRKRRHRHAESDGYDTALALIFDQEVPGVDKDTRSFNTLVASLDYFQEESDQMFHEAWHASGRDER